MTAPVITTAGDPTPQRLWTLDVNTNYGIGAANYVTAQYVETIDFNPDDANFQDSTITGDAGYSGQDAMGAAWQCTATFNRMVVPNSSPPAYDAVQEYIRNKAIGNFAGKRRIQVRIYEWDQNDLSGLYTPRTEAYMGFCSPTWPGTGGGNQADERKVAVQMMGKGKLNKISHPYPVGGAAPVVASFNPATLAVAGGTPFQIFGSGFTGTVPTTGVKLGGTNATSWTVWSDTEITGVAPAHAAGSALPVVVQNATGASTGGATCTYA